MSNRCRKFLCLIIAFVFALSFPMSIANSNNTFKVNGKLLMNMDMNELYALTDEIADTLYLKFWAGQITYNGINIYIYTVDTVNKVYHLPYCPLTMNLGDARQVWQASADGTMSMANTPCELCRPDQFE